MSATEITSAQERSLALLFVDHAAGVEWVPTWKLAWSTATLTVLLKAGLVVRRPNGPKMLDVEWQLTETGRERAAAIPWLGLIEREETDD